MQMIAVWTHRSQKAPKHNSRHFQSAKQNAKGPYRPWHFPSNWPSSMKNAYFREICVFLWILTLLLSFMKVSEFYQQHLCGFCCLLRQQLSTSNLANQVIIAKNSKTGIAWAEQWRLTVLSLDLVFIYVVNIHCSEISNVLFDRFLSLH